MKIIFSPTKTMDLTVLKTGQLQLEEASQKILAGLCALERDELGQALKIKGELLDHVYSSYQYFGQKIAPAIDLYTGTSFQQLERRQKERRTYLCEHLLILSALYGPLRADEKIAPYRLDMQAKIQVAGQSLARYWREQFAARFYERYARSDELIINLASQEFAALIPRGPHWYDIDIGHIENGKIKRPSTLSKKGRGLLLNEMAKRQVEDIEALKKIASPLKYQPEFSDEKRLFFNLDN